MKKIGISASREFKFSTTPRASSRCFEGGPRPLTRVFRAPGAWLGFPLKGRHASELRIDIARCIRLRPSLRGALDLNERSSAKCVTPPQTHRRLGEPRWGFRQRYFAGCPSRAFSQGPVQARTLLNSVVSRAQRPRPGGSGEKLPAGRTSPCRRDPPAARPTTPRCICH